MERKINDKHVGIIKSMILEGYSNKAIRDVMFIQHNQKISSSDLQLIKKGESYADVREDLNEHIFKKYSVPERIRCHEEIHEIKWALVNGYSESEIIKTFNISAKKMISIKMLYAPFSEISPEFNKEIEMLRKRKKKKNVSKQMVLDIKKLYAQKNGEVLMIDIANIHGINNGTVSNILNLKTYANIGKSYNSTIQAIKNRKNREQKRKEELKQRKSRKLKQIKSFEMKKRELTEKIKKEKAEYKVLK